MKKTWKRLCTGFLALATAVSYTHLYQTLPVQDLPGGVRLPCHGDARGGPDPGGRGHRHSAALWR